MNISSPLYYPEYKKVYDTIWCLTDIFCEENCALLGYYAVSSGNFLPMSRYEIITPRCVQTLVRNYHHSLRNNPEEHSSHLLRSWSLKSRRHFLCLKYLTAQDSVLSKLLSMSDQNHQPRRKFWQALPTSVLILTVFIATVSKFGTTGLV
jgi:hypothetical protein